MKDHDIATLATLIGSLAPYGGTVELRVPGVRVARRSQTNQEHYVQRSTLCIVAQGAKIVMIGGDTYGYEAGQMAVYSIDIPMAGRVTRASYSEPYLLLIRKRLSTCGASSRRRMRPPRRRRRPEVEVLPDPPGSGPVRITMPPRFTARWDEPGSCAAGAPNLVRSGRKQR